jgi:hypothetical protein
MEVFAIAPIPSSSEINIEYIPLITKTRQERQESLRASFGFSACLCPACTALPAEVEKSDARRQEIKSISEGLKAGRTDRTLTLAKMERIRVLLGKFPPFSSSLFVFARIHSLSNYNRLSQRRRIMSDFRSLVKSFPSESAYCRRDSQFLYRGHVSIECVCSLRLDACKSAEESKRDCLKSPFNFRGVSANVTHKDPCSFAPLLCTNFLTDHLQPFKRHHFPANKKKSKTA